MRGEAPIQPSCQSAVVLVKINAIDANRTMAPIKGARAVAVSKMGLVETNEVRIVIRARMASRPPVAMVAQTVSVQTAISRAIITYPTARCSRRRRCSIESGRHSLGSVMTPSAGSSNETSGRSRRELRNVRRCGSPCIDVRGQREQLGLFTGVERLEISWVDAFDAEQ